MEGFPQTLTDMTTSLQPPEVLWRGLAVIGCMVSLFSYHHHPLILSLSSYIDVWVEPVFFLNLTFDLMCYEDTLIFHRTPPSTYTRTQTLASIYNQSGKYCFTCRAKYLTLYFVHIRSFSAPLNKREIHFLLLLWSHISWSRNTSVETILCVSASYSVKGVLFIPSMSAVEGPPDDALASARLLAAAPEPQRCRRGREVINNPGRGEETAGRCTVWPDKYSLENHQRPRAHP